VTSGIGSVAGDGETAPPKVLISYSHDSPEHNDRVLELANRLRADGIDCAVDQYEKSPAEGWPAWMEHRIEEAHFVLVVCTETYRRRMEGTASAGVGHGVRWESLLLRQQLYDAGAVNERVIPILLGAAGVEAIPTILRPTTHYRPEKADEYEQLYRRLTGQPWILKPPLGHVRPLPPLTRQPGARRPQGSPARSAPPTDQGPADQHATAPADDLVTTASHRYRRDVAFDKARLRLSSTDYVKTTFPLEAGTAGEEARAEPGALTAGEHLVVCFQDEEKTAEGLGVWLTVENHAKRAVRWFGGTLTVYARSAGPLEMTPASHPSGGHLINDLYPGEQFTFFYFFPFSADVAGPKCLVCRSWDIPMFFWWARGA